MKTLILVEDKFGHGAKKTHKLIKKIKRIFRPKLGKAQTPFDWNNAMQGKDLKIKNQGTSSSCGGQAGAYFIETQTGEEISAKSIYAPIADYGGGTTVRQLETYLATEGANSEGLVPSYDSFGNPLNESTMTDLSWQNPQMTAEAFKRAGYTPLSIDIDIDSIAAAIRDYGAVIWEIQGQNNGTWLSTNPLPPSKSNKNEIWAHFMCSKAPLLTSNSTKQIAFFQSWGNGVGNNGIQYFDENYINSGYVVDCFTFVSDRKIVSLPPTMNVWNAVLLWFKRQFALQGA